MYCTHVYAHVHTAYLLVVAISIIIHAQVFHIQCTQICTLSQTYHCMYNIIIMKTFEISI